MFKKILFFGIAVALSILTVAVEQVLNNDFFYKNTIDIRNKTYSFNLPKVNSGEVDCIIELNIPDTAVHGKIFYKLYKSKNDWTSISLLRLNDKLVSILPYQKPNVKYAYYIELYSNKGVSTIGSKDSFYVVRFKGEVPKLISYTKTLIFFIALILSCYVGIYTMFNYENFLKYSRLVFYLLIAGIILDLTSFLIAYHHLFIVPSSVNDLSFYKNLIIFIVWGIVFYIQRDDKEKRIPVLIASLLTLILYCIPENNLFGFLY
jgi:hypothetical protein